VCPTQISGINLFGVLPENKDLIEFSMALILFVKERKHLDA
jgi:hypothetical protein